MRRILSQIAVIGLVLGAAAPARAAEATVAVAANFLTTAEALAEAFAADTDHTVRLAHGSTGRLYAQIVNGAPFDVFLSADADRPARLEAAGLAAARRTYAEGRLTLVTRTGMGKLLDGRRVAIADAEIAPYGVAALEAMAAMGVARDDVTLILGDSVGQVAAIFATGNADAAFVAEAQIAQLDVSHDAYPMAGLHAPIRQDAVLLTRGADNAAAMAFYAFLSAETARTLIAEAGYEVPE